LTGPPDPDRMAPPVQDIAHDRVYGLLEPRAGVVLGDSREHCDVVDIAPALRNVDVMDQTMALVGKDRIEVVARSWRDCTMRKHRSGRGLKASIRSPGSGIRSMVGR
jgi:hypothetical protein